MEMEMAEREYDLTDIELADTFDAYAAHDSWLERRAERWAEEERIEKERVAALPICPYCHKVIDVEGCGEDQFGDAHLKCVESAIKRISPEYTDAKTGAVAKYDSDAECFVVTWPNGVTECWTDMDSAKTAAGMNPGEAPQL